MDIELKKRTLRGDDGMKAFSIRIPTELCNRLDEIAEEVNISRNELVKILLTEGVKSVKIKE